jgi:hypothetical protein
MLNICLVSSVNNQAILENNLLRSPDVAETPLLIMQGFTSAAAAYNAALDKTPAEVIVFLHQDVYLPTGWVECIRRRIVEVNEIDPNWAVLGLCGVAPNNTFVGHVWCGAAGHELGAEFVGPKPVESVDELLIVIRRKAGLRFDENLPGFHLFGTDIAQTALLQHQGVYVVDAPVVHNTREVGSLRGAYLRSYRYMAKKWRNKLPIPTVIVPLTTHGLTLYIRELKVLKALLLRGPSKPPVRQRDPAQIAESLGYGTSPAAACNDPTSVKY